MYAYTKLNMGTKTISISDKAYKLLKSLKRDKESFSDVIERLVKKHQFQIFQELSVRKLLKKWRKPS
jgi:predicted CopG family antitoxin